VLRTLALSAADSAVQSLTSRIEADRGRPLRLIPVAQEGLPCGMWVSLEDADLVYYSAVASPGHQRHIICHELAHLLLDHPGADVTRNAARLLFTGVDPRTVTAMLSRSSYDTAEEREAELLATLILQGRRTADRPTERDARVRRLTSAMGDGPETD
jgi:hypothetical protein